jgi:hypothetical protein
MVLRSCTHTYAYIGAGSLKLQANPPNPPVAAVEPHGVSRLGRGRLDIDVATEAVANGGL